jgi:hypothetical protein
MKNFLKTAIVAILIVGLVMSGACLGKYVYGSGSSNTGSKSSSTCSSGYVYTNGQCCGVNFPYYYDGVCNQCPQGYVKTATGQCCQSGYPYYYDGVCHKCSSGYNIYDTSDDKCCPNGYPFYHDGKCHKCPAGYFIFDTSGGECCPSGYPVYRDGKCYTNTQYTSWYYYYWHS